jgi:Fic family protein
MGSDQASWALLADVRHVQGRWLGGMESLGFELREEATLQTLTLDVVKTSEIEGEKLDAKQVRSSVARRLGMDVTEMPHPDHNVEGIVELMLDATRNCDAPLTPRTFVLLARRPVSDGSQRYAAHCRGRMANNYEHDRVIA